MIEGTSVPDEGATWLALAISEATDAAEGDDGGPFGAVIVKDGGLIARARNTVLRDSDPTAHAEVGAIRAAALHLATFDLSGCVIYASCEPCPMCLGALLWARLDACWYAATRHDAAAVGFGDSDFHDLVAGDRSAIAQRFPGSDGTAPFAAYARRSDAQRY